MMDLQVDHLMAKIYNRDTYNCAHFVVDIFRSNYTEEIAETLACFLLPENKRYADKNIRKAFMRITTRSETGDILVLHRHDGETHVGFVYKGKVLHLTEKGARLQHMESLKIGFKRWRTYRYVGNSLCL